MRVKNFFDFRELIRVSNEYFENHQPDAGGTFAQEFKLEPEIDDLMFDNEEIMEVESDEQDVLGNDQSCE